MKSDSPSLVSAWSAAQPFVFGGLSGMVATAVIQPIDFIKVRIQLLSKGSSTNPIAMAAQVIRSESIFTLYSGLSAGLLRQATYTTARMGLFNTFIAYAKEKNGDQPITFAQRAVAGLAAGGLGAMIGNPCDLALIRMQADGLLEPAKRSNYTGVLNALSRIAREEGVLALWGGAGPTVVRAMALNVGMLSTYSEAKSRLEGYFGPSASATFGASAIAGFFASFLSLPFDFIKTRLQKQRKVPGQVPLYAGSIDCFFKVLRTEGPLAFYRGFGTYYVRIAPHAMVTLLVADGLNTMAKWVQNQRQGTGVSLAKNH
ncbi:mitochondrial carrier domain-containing protein [Polychytrium aggregatum]|uniref:mitochondrial carrier domain-containing protein n=1 Tax=Polychytrium aggregatum TaxID=110093 RepID=UPI0022FE6254|nr:mitochondrial carrier domain-containing protein [Polychytrium aggregatum]KAI9206454.1 mitochondrial carrier domain-containing protein [Polychytrium aggregatum]